MSKMLTNEQVAAIRTSLFSIGAFSEDITRSGASKQHRKRTAELIAQHVITIRDIITHLPDAEPTPVKKPRAPRKPKATSPAPEPMLAVEG